MSNTKHTYSEIANDYSLWSEYADPSGQDSREDFDAKTVREKVLFLATLDFVGWAGGDAEGYTLENYFDDEGQYKGPDAHGVFPMFASDTE